MLKTRVIPCMLYNGFHIVKTIKFDQMRTLGNPLQFARVYNNRNVDELIFIDLTATQEKRSPDFTTVEDVLAECFMPLTVGGGISSMEHVDHLMKIGADKILINSYALVNPDFITQVAKKYGSQCVVIGLDVAKMGTDHFVFTNRGKTNTNKLAVDWSAEAEKLGAGEIFLNSIDQDGTLEGYDLDLVKKVSEVVNIPVIACGGAGKVQDVIDVVSIGQADAVALASMFHYSGHTSNSIKERMAKSGIPVRIVN